MGAGGQSNTQTVSQRMYYAHERGRLYVNSARSAGVDSTSRRDSLFGCNWQIFLAPVKNRFCKRLRACRYERSTAAPDQSDANSRSNQQRPIKRSPTLCRLELLTYQNEYLSFGQLTNSDKTLQ